MPYREQWVLDILDGRNILSASLDVHTTACGSFERPQEEQEADVKALLHIVQEWKSTDKRFDAAVLEVVKAAITEHDIRAVAEREYEREIREAKA